MSTSESSLAEPRRRLLQNALRLEYLTVGWNVLEGIIAVAAAVAAGSVALLGFGLDSFVESASGTVLVWRLHAERKGSTVPFRRLVERNEPGERERRVRGQETGIFFVEEFPRKGGCTKLSLQDVARIEVEPNSEGRTLRPFSRGREVGPKFFADQDLVKEFAEVAKFFGRRCLGV